MMKWGRKKKVSSSTLSTTSTTTAATAATASATPSHSHLISHIIPRSWLSKFKLSSEKHTRKNVNDVKKESPRSPRAILPRKNSGYYKDQDGFWRVSLGEDSMGDDVVQQPYWGSCKTSVKEVATKKRVCKEMIVKEKERVAKEEILQRTYRRIIEATEELHRELDEVNVYRKSVEKDLAHTTNISKNRHGFATDVDEKANWQELKDVKIKQVLSKNEKQRKSLHISRPEVNNNKVRVRSPRTPSKVESCKVKAIEDMKKAKLKKKAKEIEQEEKAGVALGSFAVVKRSSDPQQDFKESMIEMIIEKRITRPEELEELLACYLTLNADEYHDLIVKVFRQVWRELEQTYS